MDVLNNEVLMLVFSIIFLYILFSIVSGLVYNYLFDLGLDPGAYIGLGFGVCTLTLIIGLTASYFIKRKRYAKRKKDDRLNIISDFNSLMQKKIYVEQFNILLSNINGLSTSEAISKFCLPTENELIDTSFYCYYQDFYTDTTRLAMLKMIEIFWDSETPLFNPKADEIYINFNRQSLRDEYLITKYPWLMPL